MMEVDVHAVLRVRATARSQDLRRLHPQSWSDSHYRSWGVDSVDGMVVTPDDELDV
jgi:hypothetical protein